MIDGFERSGGRLGDMHYATDALPVVNLQLTPTGSVAALAELVGAFFKRVCSGHTAAPEPLEPRKPIANANHGWREKNPHIVRFIISL